MALAAVLAGPLGSGFAHASANSDVYSFFASERERAAAAAASAAPAPAKASIGRDAGQSASAKSTPAGAPDGKRVSSKRQSLKTKPVRKRSLAVASPDVAREEAGRAKGSRRVTAQGKPLGYHTPARERYRVLIAQHAAANGIPFALGDAVVRVESRYQPHVSNAGALGLMQIKHSTARGLGYTGTAKGLMHPETNIKYGMKYLAQAYRLANGDTCGTVMRYQSGHYAKRINRANLAYCAKVRTIIASLGTELAATETPADGGRTRVE